MSRHIFLTGFPGFIASQLIDRLLGVDPDLAFTCLVQPHLRDVAEASLATLDAAHPGLAERTSLVDGDITKTFMGMDEAIYERESERVTHVWHLAAVYDLSVPEAIAYRVNVVGTANLLDFCEDADAIERLDYVSTCYVSGARTGLVLESELDVGQAFKNHYESTKCWAEIEVRRRMHRIPTCIHRPAIVVGDSRTGHTDKYDGPYFVVQLFMRLPSWFPTVNMGDSDVKVNIVPVDFVVDAMAALAFDDDAIDQTVALADPNPHTAREVVEAVYQAVGLRKPLADVPSSMVELLMDSDRFRQLVKVPKEAVRYFHHDVTYDTANQRRLLEKSGVRCPDLLEVIPVLVDYMQRHPDKGFLDGREF